jgi:Tol biopolymer transport system component
MITPRLRHMPLSAGDRLGPYDVLSPIGAGGMGEVYRARDARLGRDVAIKALPDLALADPARVARFEREAQVLAALNHPHVAGIYGLEELKGARFLILELVDGETLAARLKLGPPPVEEALTIARQVADAVHAAHDKGIIHRDLKPANIMLTGAGQVKVVDFGLAKALDPTGGAAGRGVDDDPIGSPTTTGERTVPGVILGTAAYMSPEQARGKPVDKRSDIWAFGCVLYELLSGRQPFLRPTVSDTMAAVLEREPDLTTLPAATPPRVRWLVRRCLEKNPSRRLHDIADARIELDEALGGSSDAEPVAGQSGSAARRGRNLRELLAWSTAAACLAALVGVLLFARRSEAPAPVATPTYNSSILLQEDLRLGTSNPPGRFTLSPDGRRLALVATDATGKTRLWIRPLNTSVAQPLAGTEDATFPFWSPDSRFVAFTAQGKLKTIDISGGPPVTLADASIGTTGSWNQDNVILYTPAGSSPIHRVSASGGPSTPVTTLDAAAGDAQHWYPFFLPDGRHFLYFAVGSKARGLTDSRAILVGSLDAQEPAKLLVESGSNAKYANGHLVYFRAGTLVAQPFDLDRLELTGVATPIVEQVQIAGAGATGAAGAYSVSETGLLAYQTGVLTRSQLAWFSREGAQLSKLGDQADYGDVTLSPDGRRAVVSVADPSTGTRDLWLFDLARGIRERFTFDPGDDFAPVWSRHDGGRIAFSSQRKGSIQIYQKALSGGSSDEVLFADSLGKFPADWSSDGKHIVYVGGGGIIGRSDLWILPVADRKAYAFLETPMVESQGQFSPDGRWLAYVSGPAGMGGLQSQIYVAAFPVAGETKRVSLQGGGWPRWRRDGKEIFYLAPDNTMTAVTVSSEGTGLAFGPARPLFKVLPRPIVRLDAFPYDVDADGQRFLVNTFVEEPMAVPITLVVNWPGGLKK